jgi:predicted enzyme related to lactoylglutathione lyase
MGRPVVHFEVMAKDVDALRTFYGELFDWKIDTDNPMRYGLVSADDNAPGSSGWTGIGGGIGQIPDGHEGYATFYVDVDDVEAALQDAVRLGGQRVVGPMEVMDGLTIGMFTDPEGHLVGLASRSGSGPVDM